MADLEPHWKPDLSRETTTHPVGHRNLVWLWVIGLILLCGAIWGVAKLTTYLQPPPRGNAVNNGGNVGQ